MPTEFHALSDHFPEHRMSTKPVWLEEIVPHPQARIDLLANACLRTEKQEVFVDNKRKELNSVRDFVRQSGTPPKGASRNIPESSSYDDGATWKHQKAGEEGLYRQLVGFLNSAENSPGIAMERQRMEALRLLKAKEPDWSLLPPASCLLSVEFQLQKSLITGDDTVFYVIDNPVCKEKVFKVPMFRASSWKGSLRWACGYKLVEGLVHDRPTEAADHPSVQNRVDERLRLARLFGNEQEVTVDNLSDSAYLDKAFVESYGKDIGREANCIYRERLKQITQKGFRAGRLKFNATFFDKIVLDIINPHERDTKVGKNPILFEVVPGKDDTTGAQGGKGIFSLLYVPFDLVEASEEERLTEAISDLATVLDGLDFLMLKSGFSAKKWAGYGIVCVDSTLKVRIISGTPRLFVQQKRGRDAFQEARQALNEQGGSG